MVGIAGGDGEWWCESCVRRPFGSSTRFQVHAATLVGAPASTVHRTHYSVVVANSIKYGYSNYFHFIKFIGSRRKFPHSFISEWNALHGEACIRTHESPPKNMRTNRYRTDMIEAYISEACRYRQHREGICRAWHTYCIQKQYARKRLAECLKSIEPSAGRPKIRLLISIKFGSIYLMFEN